MMELVLLVACLAVTVIIGLTLLNLLCYKFKPFSFFEKLALSYGLGMGAVTLEMLVFYFLKIRLNISNLLLPWIPLVVLTNLFIKPNSLHSVENREKPSLFEKILFMGISIEVFLAFFRALLKPLESFDSIAMYAIRSKIIYLSGEIAPNFFSVITKNYPNPDHPLLLPLSEVWVYTFLGNVGDLLVKIIFPMYFLSFLIIFYFLLKRFMSGKLAMLFTFILATIPQFNRFATIGYTDFILAYYYSIGTMFLFLWMKGRNIRFLVLAGIFSGLAIWTKNEGIVLCMVSFVLAGIFLIFNFKKALFGQILVFALIVALVAGPWLALRASEKLDNEVFRFSSVGLERFTDVLGKLDWIPVILYEFQKQFFGPKKWNIIWILFLVLLVMNFKTSFVGNMKYVSLSIILILFFYGSVYMLIPIKGPINWYLGSTISRLFIHFVPLVVFWLAMICNERKLISGVNK